MSIDDIKMNFVCYYKYDFIFVGSMKDGDEIVEVTAKVGGSSDDIYRLEVMANKSYVLKDGVDRTPFEILNIQRTKA